MSRKAKSEASKTRKRILSSALTLFIKKGYDKTTFVDIADSLNMTKGAVYWHFDTKHDLLAAVIDDMLSRFRKNDLCRETERQDWVAVILPRCHLAQARQNPYFKRRIRRAPRRDSCAGFLDYRRELQPNHRKSDFGVRHDLSVRSARGDLPRWRDLPSWQRTLRYAVD